LRDDDEPNDDQARARVLRAARREGVDGNGFTVDDITGSTALRRDRVRRIMRKLEKAGALRVRSRGQGRTPSVYDLVDTAPPAGPGRGNRRPQRDVPLAYLPGVMRTSMSSKVIDGYLQLDTDARRLGRLTIQQADNVFARDPVPRDAAVRSVLEHARRNGPAFFDGALNEGHAVVWIEDGTWVGFVLSPLAAGRWMALVTAHTVLVRLAVMGWGRARIGGAEAAGALVAEILQRDTELAEVQGCEVRAVRDRRTRQRRAGFTFPAPREGVPAELSMREAAMRAAADAGLEPRWLPDGQVLFFFRVPGIGRKVA
jgi:predicted ArsR family transcriptional regulator